VHSASWRQLELRSAIDRPKSRSSRRPALGDPNLAPVRAVVRMPKRQGPRRLPNASVTVPGIPVFGEQAEARRASGSKTCKRKQDVDGRVKPGHDRTGRSVTFSLTRVTVYVTNMHLARLRDVISRHA
jgi:hypothetical protein